MGRITTSLHAFNRGIVSPRALARVDVERIRLSAEIMENWTPKTQGSMLVRPGFEYIAASRGNDPAVDLAFVAATDDTALIELTDGKMNVYVDDVRVDRPSVSTSVTSDEFESATGWTDISTTGATSAIASGVLTLNCSARGGLSGVKQQVTVAAGDQGVQHALDIAVTRGPVTLRVGSTDGGDEYISETSLRTGVHSLSLTPTGDFWVQFQSRALADKIVDRCAVEAAGALELNTPWLEADLRNVRYAQSADVMFLCCEGRQQRRIERRSNTSWSIVNYEPATGPFRSTRPADIQLSAGDTYGNTTLTADAPYFKDDQIGSVLRVFNDSVDRTIDLVGDNQFTDVLRVTGVAAAGFPERSWTFTLTGTWAGTISTQRSSDGEDGSYNLYGSTLVNTSGAVDDGQANQIAFFRSGFRTGEYTSGTATIRQTYNGDGEWGIGRITAVNSATSADIEILSPFSDTTLSDNWQDAIWSDSRGWPTNVTFHQGRLWWFGKTYVVGSVSDDYGNFDPDFEGDAGPIIRTLGTGPVDSINYALSLGRLVVGTAGGEFTIKSTSFDEPLTPENAHANDTSTQGSADSVAAVKIDDRGVFAARSGKRVFELVADSATGDYRPADLTLLAPDITGDATIVGFAVQRQPDTRLHCWLSDGTVILLTYEPDEDVICWSRISTGFVENVVVLPDTQEDNVYYRVKRTVNGVVRYYLEKQAMESEAVGGNINCIADSFTRYTGAAATNVTGATHLENENVIVWADGKYVGQRTISGGAFITDLETAAENIVYGLPYTASYRSSKLAYAAQGGTALTMHKKIPYLGLIGRNMHIRALQFGQDFIDMDSLNLVQDGIERTEDYIFGEFDEWSQPVPGDWDTDARLCMKVEAPYPCELMAAVLSVETNERV